MTASQGCVCPLQYPISTANAFGIGRNRIAGIQPQHLDDGPVGGQHGQVAHFLKRDPAQRLSFASCGLSGVPVNEKKVQENRDFRVVMTQRQAGLGFSQGNAQFLIKVAPERINPAVTGLALAAGKLPAAGHVFCRPGPRPEESPRPVRESARPPPQRARPFHHHAPQLRRPWQCLYFLPEPQGQGSLRPILRPSRTKVCGFSAVAAAWPPAPAPPASACWYSIGVSRQRWRSTASTSSSDRKSV